jgi:ParB family chromosome partitioning protein
MSKKLAAKASMIQLPPVVAPKDEAVASDAAAGRAKTAPGSMVHFMSSQSAAVKEAEALRERLQQFDGARPVRALDPKTVRPSRWANRHADAYADPAFEELKAELASAGGNVQPVCVRVARAASASASGEPVYELVFGHRRHRACLELGLPLQAMVVEASDRELFESMERENRSRKNLSAWEQGVMYRRALDEGLYPSLRKLADGVGVDVSLVSKSVALARLPDVVVQAFASPLDIQFRWAQPLSEALQRDPDGVVSRAGQIRRAGAALGPAQVLDILVGRSAVPVLNGSTPAGGPTRQVIEGADGRQAVLQRDAQDRVTLKFKAGTLTIEAEQQLAAWVARLIG